VAVGRISYQPIPGHIAVLKPIIDRVTLLYKCPELGLEKVLIQNLLMATESEPGFEKASSFGTSSTKYQAAVKFTTAGGATVHLQAGPKLKNVQHDLRIEFNPAIFAPADAALFKAAFDELIPQTDWGLTYAGLLAAARVTRLDIAVDVVGARLDHLSLRVSKPGKQKWWIGEGGKHETVYFGITQHLNNAKWKSYNKRTELKDKGSSSQYGGLSHTRLEFTDTPNMSVNKLGKRPNPFVQVSLAYAAAYPPAGVEQHNWEFFLDACLRRGEQSALAIIPHSTVREAYKQSLDKCHEAFWKPHEIWKAWPAALASCSMLG
jgi:hypothetical protein